ncbi:YheC/YheD family protein [Effusibacillus lacus]|uniref:Endospore coat-associated protein n=1 Tax=Effusibacillus lacus TaxID=1348429 RepID=A0A292YTI4_9BACL|nr:YheC/YheD family protein [Effusibacillus lacus]TCS76240.1 YheC/D-like protein [Effusibacillus lacus]GAX91790.1 endospore coat-associated protein [Effusibacillus lacus]
MIVGILTAKLMDRGNMREFIKTGKRMKIPVYVIPIDSMDMETLTCEGYRWNGKWERVLCPFPTVVYNRILARRVENGPIAQQVLRELENLEIPVFNPGYFDKGKLYKIVGSHSETRELLPETEELHSLSHLREMLETCRQLYAKPVQSYGGKGIIRIDYADNEALVWKQLKGIQTCENMRIQDLYYKLSQNRRHKKYVLQKGISLARVNGHIYDLRVLVQKNRYGNWCVTGVGARVAPRYGILTHVPNGGAVWDAREALLASFHKKGVQILDDVKDKALKLAAVIEKKTPGILGEMSMDIGVDEEGRPWFFEANAKPGKFDEPEIQKLSIQRVLEFCRYLSFNRAIVESRK